MKLINLIIACVICFTTVFAWNEEWCYNSTWDWVDLPSGYSSTCRQKIRNGVNEICQLSNGWTWAKDVKNAKTTCEAWKKHNNAQKALDIIADRYGCKHVSMSYWLGWGC